MEDFSRSQEILAKRWAPRDGFPEEPLDNYMDVSTDDYDHNDNDDNGDNDAYDENYKVKSTMLTPHMYDIYMH